MRRFAPIRQLIPVAVALAATACSSPEACPDKERACRVEAPGQPDEVLPGDEWGDPVQGPGDTTAGGSGATGTNPMDLVDADGDGFRPVDGDCDDGAPAIHPDARELCDQIDNDCNGLVDDDLGHVSASATDSGADGTNDYVSYTTYRNTGQLWFRLTDSDGDTVIDGAEEYFYLYDGMGRLEHIDTDDLIDGSIDERKTYFYDATGRLESSEEDIGLDGVPDRIDQYLYDEQGRRVTWLMDTDGDGFVNTMYSYDYDPLGVLRGLTMDRFNGAGALTSSSVYSYDYDANGMIEAVHVDLTADGAFDNTTSYVYDALGRMSEALTDVGRDLITDTVTVYHYNPAGDLEKIEIDSDNDGQLDTRITRWETCDDTVTPPTLTP